MLADTHCHLDFPQFDPDRAEVIRRAKASGLKYLINVAADLKSSQGSCALANEYDFIYASVGVHPHDADNFDLKSLKEIELLAKNKRVVAIGETGLDYYRNYSEKDNQKKLFSGQIDLAEDLNLPLIIHTRNAETDTLEILKRSAPLRAVVHCFSGDEAFLHECLNLDFFISFTCNITYEKAQNLRDIVKLCPLEKIFLETDAPYLSPDGQRGKRNEPANVVRAAEEIAKIKEVSLEEVGEVTTLNAESFFKLE